MAEGDGGAAEVAARRRAAGRRAHDRACEGTAREAEGARCGSPGRARGRSSRSSPRPAPPPRPGLWSRCERAAEVARAREAEAPRQLGRLRQADARPDQPAPARLVRATSSNGGRSSGRPSCSRVTPSAWQSRPGPRAEQTIGDRRRAARASRRDRAVGSSARTQDGGGHALLLADEVQAPVDAVRAVDVRVAARQEHRAVPRACGGSRTRARPGRPGGTPRPRRSPRRRRRRRARRRSAPARPRAPAAGRTPPSLVAAAGSRRSGGTRGRASAAATQPTMQSTPPETTEKRSEVSEARTPASRSPRFGAPATCANSIPVRRPEQVRRRRPVEDRLAQDRAEEVGTAGEREQDERRARRVVVKPKRGDRAPQTQAATVTRGPGAGRG